MSYSKKRVGYSYWGFLADVKLNESGNVLSTPDGNAFYSWSIINEYRDRGTCIQQLMPDRDKHANLILGPDMFSAWLRYRRFDAYADMIRMYSMLEDYKLVISDLDYAILEWRFLVPGRNDLELKGQNGWQPDLYIQEKLIEALNAKNIPFVVFDLDYKLTEEDIKEYGIKYVIELGDKWKDNPLVKSKRVEIPFYFNGINYFNPVEKPAGNLVYIGNRYERDWCIDKYIPEYLEGVKVYGNWNEAGRDSKERWPKIDFGGRLQTRDMHDAYKDYIATILLAKEEYCKMGFMTARLIEAIFYGVVPLFISEYGKDTINKYAGKYAEALTVDSKSDVDTMLRYLRFHPEERLEIISYLRNHLRFMDARYFVDDVEDLIQNHED